MAKVKKGECQCDHCQRIDEVAAQRAGIRGIQVVKKRNAADLTAFAGLVDLGTVKPRLGSDSSVHSGEGSAGTQ